MCTIPYGAGVKTCLHYIATKNVQAEEQLSVQYVTLNASFTERQESLKKR